MQYVLALDFGGTKIDVGTARLDGELLLSERLETRADQGALQAVERALDAARDLAARSEGDCLGAGAVSPGIVEEERVLLAPNVPGWDGLRLPSLLREGLGLDSISVANDVNAAALAEARWGALAGSDVSVFVSLGTGVKAGVVIADEFSKVRIELRGRSATACGILRMARVSPPGTLRWRNSLVA